MTPLLIFGDSWSHGAELNQHELAYGELLATGLGYTCCNFSQPSTSIPHLLLQLRSALDQGHSDCTAVFFLTGVDRDLVWHHGKTRELNPTHPADIDWYAKYNSPELTAYRTNATLVALQAMCAKRNIRDYYIWGWDQVDLWSQVDTARIYNQTVADVFLADETVPQGSSKIMHLKNSRNQYIWPNSGHPNQLGHQRIADLLQEWICT
jgi:lysophospholipase L1-like esterase